MSPLPPTAEVDPLTLSVPELVEWLKAGRVTSESLVRRCLERLASVQATLNPVTYLRRDAALAEARALDERRAAGKPVGRLHGVPITVKDCLDVKGLPSTFGFPSRANTLASSDDAVVARMRAEGAVVIAKTNVAQGLAFHETDNPLFGRTSHPADVERSPGGSSGGEAVALASGGSMLGLGTDIGGSIRVPAHACGLVGFKPTAGTLDDLGRHSFPFGQRAIRSQVGLMARDVATVQLGFQVATGQAPAEVDLRGLEVATFDDDNFLAACPASRRAVAEAARTLRDAGATVTALEGFPFAEAQAFLFGIFSADGLAGLMRSAGSDPLDDRIAKLGQVSRAGPLMRRVLKAVVGLSGRKQLASTFDWYGHTTTDRYWQLVERLEVFRGQASERLGSARLLLSPSYPLPALRHGASAELITAGAYVSLHNVLGWPAGVIPWTTVHAGEESGRPDSRDLMHRAARDTERGSTGLPIGIQLSARTGEDAFVLAAMRALEPLSIS